MKSIFIYCITLLFTLNMYAQHTFKAIVKDADKRPLQGTTAAIRILNKSAVADSNGLITLKNIPAGKFKVMFSHVGFQEKVIQFEFPIMNDSIIEIELTEKEHEENEVVVTSTRTSRSIANIPTRIETISGEELQEKGNMKPGDIRMMLNESTGIQTQQTSATSYNSSIRIQGLDGKYTQIIRDGFPLYSGFSGGLGLLQIVPLDLKQVEVIKGSSSTLYGGGAIAGLVNLISKSPGSERELNFMVNGTSALGLDASSFYSQKFNKVGTTIFASYNHGTPYDPAHIGLTAIPKYDRYTLNPKLFFYFSKNTTANFGVNATYENRVGGDTRYIEGRADSIHSYFEKNKTNRYSTQLSVEHTINDQVKFSFKNSLSYYNRSIQTPGYIFSGVQLSSYSEVNLNYKKERVEWIGGINFLTDKFTQDKKDTIVPVNYNQNTIGAFVQNTWTVTKIITLETGLRGDYQNDFGFFLLPRLSALFKISKHFTSRVGGGLGYKIPNVFTEDAEKIQFKNVLPIDIKTRAAEKSYGGNLDINYHTTLFNSNVSLSINHLFFYTRINNPLVLTRLINGYYEYLQPKGFIDTRGIETNVKLIYKNFKLFIGYTFADVKQHYATTTEFPLVAKHRLNNVLVYEIEDKLKAGLEAYYYSPQKLNDGATGKAYWLTGFMIEKLWKHFSIFANFENFTDTRQTKFDTIYEGTITNPVFRDIYAPVDGFVLNGGFKIKL
ncbi:TonB-dependent receptor [Ginsengibacter hankyongi]|uniref:TonB-dependent receptor n=2 Tax=Ginsengibacter hankyongi TaxID=2607284 RepID=A0A5J5INK2_9BACT|nr:TonB-dependent receptor [Ginsengibacter hankyongi]